MGFIGDDSADSGYVGAWFLRCGIGGAGPLVPSFFCGTDGKVVATALYIADNTGASGLIGSGISWFKRLAIGGPDAAHPKILCDIDGNVSIPGALVSGSVLLAASASSANTVPGSGVTGSMTGGNSGVTLFSILDAGSNTVVWMGKLGSDYGFWGKNVWVGGSGPASAPFKVDSTGKLSIAMTSTTAGATPFQLDLNNVLTSIGNTYDANKGWYKGLALADKTALQLISVSVGPSASASFSVLEGSVWKVNLISTYTGGSALQLYASSGGYLAGMASDSGGASLNLQGPAGKTFQVDCPNASLAIGAGMNLFASGAQAQSVTISFTKPGGATGTLTYTKGLLTGNT